MRRILAFFGLALASDLRRTRISLDTAADIGMLWLDAAFQLQAYALALQDIIAELRESATIDTPKQ